MTGGGLWGGAGSKGVRRHLENCNLHYRISAETAGHRLLKLAWVATMS